MTIDRMIEMLDIEHACVRENKFGICNRKCGECDLMQDDGELHEMYTDVIGLLKEQEPKEPLIENVGNISKIYGCPTCRKMIYRGQCFCDECGQAVKWE